MISTLTLCSSSSCRRSASSLLQSAMALIDAGLSGAMRPIAKNAWPARNRPRLFLDFDQDHIFALDGHGATVDYGAVWFVAWDHDTIDSPSCDSVLGDESADAVEFLVPEAEERSRLGRVPKGRHRKSKAISPGVLGAASNAQPASIRETSRSLL